MTPDSIFRRLQADLSPEHAAKNRVRGILQKRIGASHLLAKATLEATPTRSQHASTWQQIAGRIDSVVAKPLFERIRTFLAPDVSVQQLTKMHLLSRLEPAPVPLRVRSYRWIAAFVIVALLVQISPVLFVATPTIAESAVVLVPTVGQVELSLHNLWQPVGGQVTLNQEVSMRTQNGEATILLHDNGNVRLANATTLTLHDVSDHSSPSFNGPTMTLTSGTAWLQGLLPDNVRGFTIATPQGDITVHGGSVSVAVTGSATHVEVWDRYATVSGHGKDIALVAGESIDVGDHALSAVHQLPSDAYKGPWVAQNIERDAVHQREMAEMQEERRAAQAGILPTSPLYAVKRAAEAVDVMLTLDPQAKVQKRLDQATTRLNEAAALIAAGDSGAQVALDEYKQTLMSVASGSGGDSNTQALVQQTVAENTAQLSAALPDDSSYALKKTVLEASAQIPDGDVGPGDVSGMLLVDTLDALQQAVQSGSGSDVHATLQTLVAYLPSLNSTGSTLKPEVKKEALSLLSDVAAAAQSQTVSGVRVSSDIASVLSPYLPKVASVPARAITVAEVLPSLTDEELDAAVHASLHRIFDIFNMPQSRENQLRIEMKAFQGSPDEGRYLRRLYADLPDGSTLQQLVRHAIQMLREEQLLKGLNPDSGSGVTEG
jgi:hypothetical protein